MIDVDVSLDVGDFSLRAKFHSDARVTALFGRSGAGKSTIVKAIGGLARPQKGRIQLGDEVLFDADKSINLPARLRRIGHVFQDARLFPHLTVEDNLAYGGRFAAHKPPASAWEGVIQLLDIAPLLRRFPVALSGGEVQRVAIGRALLMSPRALMMDEPLASLDGKRKAEILPYLERLTAETQVPILYVSHALEEALRLAGAMVVVKEGIIVASGAIEDLLANDNQNDTENGGGHGDGGNDLSAAMGVVGGGSVLIGKVARRDTAYALTEIDLGGQSIWMPQLEAKVGQTVAAFVSALDVVLARERPTGLSTRNILKGRVRDVTLATSAGGEKMANADVVMDVEGRPLRARITRQAVDELEIVPGLEIFALVKSVAMGGRR